MNKLEARVRKLEQPNETAGYCLLYPNTWSDGKLAAEVAKLEKTHKSILAIDVDDDAEARLVHFNSRHEDALKELD